MKSRRELLPSVPPKRHIKEETLFKKKGIEPVRKVRKKDKHLLDASVFVEFPIFHSPSSRTWYLNYDN
ncbi:hypothetical protein D3846_04215 [Streptococcus mutans]|uniref:hypothetical protein n=1 Tax=Streptococcus intermedius TaxID=1338 RepID=UPI0002B56C1B|nr:hypothetical protein [Streptococcus intermedius]AVM72454.1 hypothetical protein CO204_00265 [Streptococcus mutans]EMC21267.1 hypothetical protein SMU80_03325 [Streptococcus mutans SF1]EMC42473.1 hypothetical protein SMU98_07746 [Streptococcus mutans SM1]ALF26979.1 hypothetical protein RN88_00085 [Streptococcus intermedius]ARC26655.1 hypothetical protein A6J72_05160 [Streptococcus intermedius]